MAIMARTKIEKSELLFTNRYIFNLTLPLLIETILNVTIGMADTIMVSSAGEASVSGVSLVDSLANLFIFMLSAFATGGAVVATQYMGRQDKEHASSSAKQLIQLAFISALACSLILLLGQDFMMDLVFGSIEPDVDAAASGYFLPIVASLPFLAVLNSANAISRSMGRSRITMVVALIMNTINISGNALFIYVFRLGATGAGIASLISRIIASAIMLTVLYNRNLPIHISKVFKPSLEAPMVRRILRIALPSGVENSIFQIGKILTMSIITSIGTVAITANAVMNSIATVTNIPGTAINMAAVTIVGQCCGAGKYDQAEYYAKKLLGVTYLMLLAISVLIFVFMEPIIGLYNLGPESHALTREVVVMILVQTAIFWPPAFSIPNYLRAAGDVKFPMYVSIASMWIFRVTLARILGLNFSMGLMGVCWAMYIDWYARLLFFIPRFKSGRWKTKRVI